MHQLDERLNDLLLRHRGRTGLTQRELAARIGVHMRSVQDWESGSNCPTADRLQLLVAAFLEAGGFTTGHEADEAEALAALMTELGPRVGRGAVLEGVEALRRRSLLERDERDGVLAFKLPRVVLEYLSDHLVEAAAGGSSADLIESAA